MRLAHLSHIRARNSKTKKRRKIKLGINVHQGTSKRNANLRFKRSKVSVTGSQKPPQKSDGIVYLGYERQINRRWHPLANVYD